jgi:hypothetical protein
MIRLFSSGGGVQSIAALVLSAQRVIDFPLHVFANTGDDSEAPKTLAYVRDIAMPYAHKHGIEFIERVKVTHNGQVAPTVAEETLGDTQSIPIPVFPGTGGPWQRSCTAKWKIRVVSYVARERGATKKKPASIGLGISMDEFMRANSNTQNQYTVNVYPLLDLRLTRQDCINIIVQAGLPVPPKSACYFCPFTRLSEWQRLASEDPDTFQKAVVFEKAVQAKAQRLHGKNVYLTRTSRPLDRVVGGQAIMTELDDDVCDSGYCFM